MCSCPELTFVSKSSLEVERGVTCFSSWPDYCSRLRLAFGFPAIGHAAGFPSSAGDSAAGARGA